MLQLFPQYKIKKKVRLIELFAGYGSQALALENIGVEFEHHKVVEFDEYAIKSYNSLHDTNYEAKDITKINDLDIVNKDKYDYIMTYSFPCTDLSLAGKRGGMKKGTRSGLLWEVERLLNQNELPQILIMENVTQVHSVSHKEDFNQWIEFLASKGYSNQWKDLNAKHYGIPQNRDRTFMVSILGDYEYHFPKPIPLELKLKDMLEDNVDDKYYLSKEKIKSISKWKAQQDPFKGIHEEKEVVQTLTARGAGEEHSGMVLINESINIYEATKKGYAEATSGDGIYINRPHQKRGVVQKDMIQTIKTSSDDLGVVLEDLKIRKITPRECFRLMGLNDIQIDKVFKSGNSNTQLYKQAGNSIVVQVLENIFKELF